jgi:hypothetical protein
MFQLLQSILEVSHIKLVVFMQLYLFLLKLSHFPLESGTKFIRQGLDSPITQCLYIHDSNFKLSDFGREFT